MLAWFLRQRAADKIAVGLCALALTPVIWTAVASAFFIMLMGQGMRQIFPFTEPDSYWQWWAYFLDDAQPVRIHQWLAVSGVASVVPFGAFIARQVMGHLGDRSRRPALYGSMKFADRERMSLSGIKTSRKPIGRP